MRIVILGADGFLGSHIVSALKGSNLDIVAFCPRSPRLEVLRRRGVTVIEGDFLDLSTLSIPFEGVDWVVHLASTTTPIQSIKDPVRDAANLDASKMVFRMAVEAGVKRILFSSSGGTVYGNNPSLPARETDPTHPSIPYAKTKLEIERDLLSRCAGTETVPLILRYANPYGPNQYPAGGTGVVTAWLESARNGEPITLYGDGDTARDFLYVSDAASAALGALRGERARGVYNVGTGIAVSLNTLLRTVEEVIGERLLVRRLPSRTSDTVRAIALDSTRAYLDFGWRPTVSLSEGIARTWKWVQSGENFTID